VSLHTTLMERSSAPATALTRPADVDSETVFVGLDDSDASDASSRAHALETAIRQHDRSRFTPPPAYRPAPASTRPLQSLYA